MTTYGVTPTGFVRPSVEDILADIESDQRSLVSQHIDTAPETPIGQINGITARQLGMAWEALETAYNAFDVDRAEDFLLTALGKLTGTTREGATPSTVSCVCVLTAGTTLQAGVHFARVAGKPNVRFTPRANFTAPSTGSHTIVFQSEVPGPVAAASGTITVIATAVVGWSSVTNQNPATLGTVAEQDPAFRAKRETDLARAGNQTFAAIKAGLAALRNSGAAWVLASETFENASNVVDGEGRQPHTFEVLVNTDISTRPTNWANQIAQVIWDNKPGGIIPWSSTGSGGTATNEKGESVAVAFAHASTAPVYVSLTLTTVPGFTGTAAVKDAIVSQAAAAYSKPGSTVVALNLRSMALAVPGVIDVPTLTLGITPSPVGTGNLTFALRVVPLFDVGRIVIT